jgi:hypothetical protein
MRRVYLDNDVYSIIVRRQVTPESPAIEIIQRWAEEGRIELVTSEVHRRETSRVPAKHRQPFDENPARFPQATFVEDHALLGFNNMDLGQYGFISYPLIEDDPISRTLRQIGLSREDAHHLMLAIRSSCDLFLTCDKKIIHRHRAIEAAYAISVMKPSKVVAAALADL